MIWNIKCFLWFNYAFGFSRILCATALETQQISDQYQEVSSCKILQAKVSEIWLCCNYDWPHVNNGHGFIMHQIAQVTYLNLFPHCTSYKNQSFQSIIICVQRFQYSWITTQYDGHLVIIKSIDQMFIWQSFLILSQSWIPTFCPFREMAGTLCISFALYTQ